MTRTDLLRPRRSAASVVTFAAALLIAGCAADESSVPFTFPEPPPAGSSSLLLITLDTFRADAAGCGGSPVARTPHLDRLARGGIQWETAWTVSPLTLPSHATMLTGLDPAGHGARSNSTFRMNDEVVTLAETLGERGFATGAFVAAATLNRKFGIDQGFDVFDDGVGDRQSPFGMGQRDGDDVVDAALEWAATLDAGRRRFEWVHLFDAHDPYTAPGPRVAASGNVPYLGDVSLADTYLGLRLRARDLAGDATWVVVLGDHGESLGEHREQTHGLFLYGATMRIPAVLSPAPAGEARGLRRGTLRTIDFPATAFGLLGFDAEDAPGAGVSSLGGEAPPMFMESIYAYVHYGWASIRAIIDGRWKYIEAPTPELYDLAADPGEIDNIASEHPDIADELAERLAEIAVEAAAPSMDLDDASREALESLGYVTTVAEAAGGDRPDPKDMVRVNELVMRASEAAARGNAQEARMLVARGLDLDPDNKELHRMMGILLSAEGRFGAAIGWFVRCIDLPPDNGDPYPHAQLGICYLKLGRNEEALRVLETAIELDPERAVTWSNLGLARRRLGDERGAQAALRRALEIDPGLESARQLLGR